MFSIGQFSRITGLSIKTIRLYHERGLLEPKWIDEQSCYRYFDSSCVERARAIAYLRELEFPLAEIKEILDSFEEEGEILGFLEKQRGAIASRIDRLGAINSTLDDIIRTEKEARSMLQNGEFEVGEKRLESLEVAGLRWKGKYGDTGKVLGQVARLAGRFINGKPMNLYYDSEYKDDDADIETCFPVHTIPAPGALMLHRLPGGKCVYLIHRGRYELIGRSYEKLMQYIQKKKYPTLLPSRELYLKGPGMIFRGNSRNYLTEIQILISTSEEGNNALS
jgi:DNA-binding transcriptional MerR regulator/effector-binding domain-containing protein